MPYSTLLSVPPAMVGLLRESHSRWTTTSDPAGSKLGSGGGVAHLLREGWKQEGGGQSFDEWLAGGRKLALLAGGQSRRLPAYAAEGKIFLPMPALRWAAGQRLDQTLLDLQLPEFERVLLHAPESAKVLVATGDVLLKFSPDLPEFPDVDVLGLGMWVDAETASHFGVFFSPREEPSRFSFFLQKPSPAEIRRLAADHLFLVDTGMWLLSERAAKVLLAKSDEHGTYELYAGMGLALGADPRERDPEINALSAAVVALPDARFYHFGTTRQMIESASALQNADLDQSHFANPGMRPHPDVYVLNAEFDFTARSSASRNVWVENCALPPDLPIRCENVLTGIPAGDWDFALESGVCIDLVPIGATDWCVRVYGFDDPFRGAVRDEGTLFLGAPASEWHRRRGLEPEGDNIQNARLFPVLPGPPDSRFLEWMFAANPTPSPAHAELWKNSERLSAQEIGERANLARLRAQRTELTARATPKLFAHRAMNIFSRLDLGHTAELFAKTDASLPAEGARAPMDEVHEAMFRAAVLRLRGDASFAASEEKAFAVLREVITQSVAKRSAHPRRELVDDQIAWGRSPVRLDFAGGWSDTAPYCLKNGGAVVNVAVDLNGQPPAQVYVRQKDEREIVIRSIDLGAETRVRTLHELTDYARVGGEFSLAKAALALAGFEPRFAGAGDARTLEDALEEFGGGIEISLLAATPKGSGLGTSSVLAATLLGTLSEACGLAWDEREIFQRTLALEQLMTTGGGWQDQAGGIFRGLKMIETAPGLAQNPELRWLPTTLFNDAAERRLMLLYYTGLRRVAKDVLQEVVRGMFLNRGPQLGVLDAIKRQAHRCFEVVQRDDWDGFCRVVAGSWELNQRLDSGTNPAPVQKIFAQVEDWLAGGKLLGAGGGGYMVMLAKDADAALAIRRSLEENPPNARARFVDFNLSETGLQVTRS